MARRKNGFLSDGSDDSNASDEASEDEGYNSQEDGDSRAERALFEHNGRKRRKTAGQGRGKVSAWEGIFGEDEDTGRAGGRGLGSKRGGGRGGKSNAGKTDWTKAPTFVTKSNTQEGEEAEPGQSEEDEDEDEDDDSDEDKPPSPRVREDDYDDDAPVIRAPRAPEPEEKGSKKKGGRLGIGAAGRGGGGIGSGSASGSGRTGMPSFAAASSVPESEESTPAASPHPGLGSRDAPSAPMEETTPAQTPAPKTSFGRPPSSLTESSKPSDRPRQSFLTRPAAPAAAPAVPLTAAEQAHFNSISGDWAAKMLARQGWQPGKGLGVAEDGRAVPIAAGVHLRGAGIAKGVRTEDSKREARRKGEKFSDDEEEEERARRRGKGKKGPSGQGQGQGQGNQQPREDSWKKQKKVKVRVEHKTYEQLVAEATDGASAGIGLVLDARSGEMKEVQSMSNLSSSTWTPTSDATQLPELRHNLRLIVDIAKGDVEALAREGKSVNERRKWAVREEQLARQKIEETEKRINRLTKVQELVKTISTLANEQSAELHPSLSPLADSFNTLLDGFAAEYASEQLDEVIVGAIAQVMRRPFSEWEPFDPSSDILLSTLKSWKRAYNLSSPEINDTQSAATRQMTAWESVLWNLWLPKVRSTINNDWDATHPRAAIHLIESWEPILPAFIRDNIIDQLILPKVRKAVDEWDTRKQSVSLYKIVWPWFSVLGERMDEILEGAKRRIRSVFRHWVVKDGIPKELSRWKKDIYSSSEWDKLVLQYIVPKLGVCLRDDFAINPANQNMTPFSEWVMPWHELIRGSMMAHLLDVEFFPKWLDTLYLWLVHPGYKPDEVANWFLWWKSQFPEQVRDHPSTQHAFKQALDLMNQAVELGSMAPQRLRKPVFQPLPPKKSSSSTSKSKSKSKPSLSAPRQQAPDQTDITFRSLAEDYAAQNDLIFLPLGKSDPKTGKPLFKVSQGVDGRKGVTVYVGESAVFAQAEDGAFRAISLDDMVKRALS